jgi:hypothetical protein
MSLFDGFDHLIFDVENGEIEFGGTIASDDRRDCQKYNEGEYEESDQRTRAQERQPLVNQLCQRRHVDDGMENGWW